MKSLEHLVLPSTTPRLRGGWSQLGRIRLVGLQVGGFEGTPPLCVQMSPPHTAFPADSIERSADLVEPGCHVQVMAAPQSADGDLVLH